MPSVQTYTTVLETIAEASRQMSLAVPTGIYDSSDENVLLMGSNINNIGIMVLDHRKVFQQFRKEFTITGDGVTLAFDVPADYNRLVNNTGWSYAMRRPVRLVDAQYWAAYKASLISISVQPIFRLFNDQFNFITAPADGEEILFEYVTRNWVIDADGITLKAYATKNADTPKIDSLLMVLATKMEFRKAKGFDTAAESTDFNDRLLQLQDANVPGDVLSLNGSPPFFPLLSGQNLPPSGYG